MNVMTYKNYHARIDFDETDELFIGRLAGITDVVGFHAEDVQTLKKAFHEAVDDYLQICVKIGKKPEKSFSGRIMFRVDPKIHAKATLAADLSGKSLNQWAEEVLRQAADKSLAAG